MAEKQAIKGRRKIPMRRIEGEEDRLITFSKRRAGIYKKATEISTLCGAEVGVLMFSPAGKPFAYGIPDIEAVAAEVLRRGGRHQQALSSVVTEALRRDKMGDLNRDCDELSADLLSLKKEGETLDGVGVGWWWDVPVEDLKADEMDKMTETMEEVGKNAGKRHADLMAGAAAAAVFSSSPPSSSSSAGLMAPPCYVGAGFADPPVAFDGVGYGGINGYYC